MDYANNHLEYILTREITRFCSPQRNLADLVSLFDVVALNLKRTNLMKDKRLNGALRKPQEGVCFAASSMPRPPICCLSYTSAPRKQTMEEQVMEEKGNREVMEDGEALCN